MVRNIVFDMGNVLIKYEPELFLDRAGIFDAQERELLMTNIFHSSGWREMDAGTLDEEGLYQRAIKVLPSRFHDLAHELIFSWSEPLIPVDGMYELVRWCHEKDLGIYLLSNASVRQPLYWQTIPIKHYFSGVVVSALEKCMKPEARLYEILLNRYSLKAEECLFIDDSKLNVEGAKAVGMKGWLFENDPEELQKYISEQIQ